MQRDDGERKAAFEVVREAAIPLLRATDRARNFAVFVSAGAGIAVFGGRSLTTVIGGFGWRLGVSARVAGCEVGPNHPLVQKPTPEVIKQGRGHGHTATAPPAPAPRLRPRHRPQVEGRSPGFFVRLGLSRKRAY